MKQWYEELFENYAEKYDNESFTTGTIGECDFIENEINFNKALKIIPWATQTNAKRLRPVGGIPCRHFSNTRKGAGFGTSTIVNTSIFAVR